jgi:hypothetical protein
VSIDNGTAVVHANGSGQAKLMVVYRGLTASATVNVLASGIEPPSGTVLWSLESGGVPARGVVLPAAPVLRDDPLRGPAMFFVDEGAQWFGPTLTKMSAPTIRATRADGRELWSRAFVENTTIKHVAADQRGGMVIVWNQWLDQARGIFYPDRVQRLDGETGDTTWEYVPVPSAILSDVAVHPDGRLFFAEQRFFGQSNLLVVSPAGSIGKWPLPSGHATVVDSGTGVLSSEASTPARPSHPIITDDGVAMLVTQRTFSVRNVISTFEPDGVHSRDDFAQPGSSVAQGHVIEVHADGGMGVRDLAVPPVEWASFRPEEYRLMPDGSGGLILGHRAQPSIVRITAGGQLVGPTRLFDTTGTYTYGSEFVLGDDGAHLLIHGAANTGLQHFTRTARFDPLSLALTASNFVGDFRASPSHLRLQFAFAGGGIYASGPAATGGSHFTPVAGDVWGAWSGGPAAVIRGQAEKADTEWPSRQGSARGANAAFRPGFGIFAKAHPIAEVGRHVSLRIVPHNQLGWLADRPDVFNNVDDRGRFFATIGAGPPDADTGGACDGSLRLISGINRHEDVMRTATSLERLEYDVASENIIINKLLRSDAGYGDGLPYCFFAPPGPMYNSNSYASGLLGAARLAKPMFPLFFPPSYPGWRKPVPASAFEVKQ